MPQSLYKRAKVLRREDGRLAPVERTERLDMRTTPLRKKKVEAMAEKNDKKPTQIVDDAIDEKFAREFPRGLPKVKQQ